MTNFQTETSVYEIKIAEKKIEPLLERRYPNRGKDSFLFCDERVAIRSGITIDQLANSRTDSDHFIKIYSSIWPDNLQPYFDLFDFLYDP